MGNAEREKYIYNQLLEVLNLMCDRACTFTTCTLKDVGVAKKELSCPKRPKSKRTLGDVIDGEGVENNTKVEQLARSLKGYPIIDYWEKDAPVITRDRLNDMATVVLTKVNNVFPLPIVEQPSQQKERLMLWGEPAVVYFTDIEGDWKYFNDVVEQAVGYLIWRDPKTGTAKSRNDNPWEQDYHLDFTKPDQGDYLVHGGDAVDWGNGSVRFVDELLQMKDKYGERVQWILGNRDINKMRFTSDIEYTKKNPTHYQPYWECAKSPKPDSCLTYNDWKMTQTYDISKDEDLAVIQFILEKTMNAKDDVKFRRDELSIMQSGTTVTDQQLALHYKDFYSPGGAFGRFLQEGKLVFIHENTLFVHGGLTLDNMNKVPFMDDPFKWSKTTNASGFEEYLNQWKTLQLESWKKQATWKPDEMGRALPGLKPETVTSENAEQLPTIFKGYTKENCSHETDCTWDSRGGNRLIAYVAPGSEEGDKYSPVLTRLGDVKMLYDQTTDTFNEKLVQYLKNISPPITRVVVGHTPAGDTPFILSAENLQLIGGDISYAEFPLPGNLRHDGSASVCLLFSEYTKIVGKRIQKDCKKGADGITTCTKGPEQKFELIFSVPDKQAFCPEGVSCDDKLVGKEYKREYSEVAAGEQKWTIKLPLNSDSEYVSQHSDFPIYYHEGPVVVPFKGLEQFRQS